MKKVIEQILRKIGCFHKWKIHHIHKIFMRGEEKKLPIEARETLICEICGKIKRITL